MHSNSEKTMNLSLIFPMAVMVFMTFLVLMTMFRRRVRAVKAGEADARFYKTYQEGREPREIAQFSRHFVNLFEAPTLFYVACVAGLVTGIHASAMLWLAWLYVALRVLHSWIHLGTNSIPPRIRAYFVSWLVLLAMWAVLVAGALAQQ